LCVTHLPQVAAQGHQHLRVTKHAEAGRTRTAVALLSPIARVEEVARMLGGVEITARARAHAREMLNQAEKQGASKSDATDTKTALSSPPGSSA
jgi:DNA repair protein RecN (Recombination protein N)